MTAQKQVQDLDAAGKDCQSTISNAFREAFEDQRWKRIKATRDESNIQGQLFYGGTFEADVFVVSHDDFSGVVLINGRSHDGNIRGFVKSEWQLQDSKIEIRQPTFHKLLSE